jgi:beta-aspartyl-peptidase (threonine type)
MKHCLWILLGISMMSAADESPIAIALHGGAGTIERGAMSAELEATYRAFLDDAITSGYEQLREGRSGLDVVVTVIQMMEDSPVIQRRARRRLYLGRHPRARRLHHAWRKT